MFETPSEKPWKSIAPPRFFCVPRSQPVGRVGITPECSTAPIMLRFSVIAGLGANLRVPGNAYVELRRVCRELTSRIAEKPPGLDWLAGGGRPAPQRNGRRWIVRARSTGRM